MTKINLKQILEQVALPLVLYIVSLFTIFVWYDKLAISTSPQIISLLNILPYLPYLLFGILVLLAFRENNRQMLIKIVLSTFTYLILTQIDFDYLKNIVVDSYYIELLLLLVGLNLVLISEHKKAINTRGSLIIFSLILLQIIIYFFIAKSSIYLHSEMYHDFQIEFPKIAAFINNFSSQILIIFRSDKYYLTSRFPWLSICYFIVLELIIMIKYIYNTKHFFWQNAFLMLYLISTLLSPDMNIAAVINFNLLAITFFILLSEAHLSLAYIDELTALPTRRKMNEVMQSLGSNYSIAMIDVDKFKLVNDKYGHKSGDQALQLIASNLASMRGNAKVFRFAGDEFTAIFPGKSAEEAAPFLEEFRNAVTESKFIIRDKERYKKSASDRNKKASQKQKTAKLSVSIGVAGKDKHANTPLKVLKQADKKLYKSKKAGRNKVSS